MYTSTVSSGVGMYLEEQLLEGGGVRGRGLHRGGFRGGEGVQSLLVQQASKQGWLLRGDGCLCYQHCGHRYW